MNIESTGFDPLACLDELFREQNRVTEPDGITGERFIWMTFQWLKFVKVFDIYPVPVEQEHAISQVGAGCLQVKCFAVSNGYDVISQWFEM